MLEFVSKFQCATCHPPTFLFQKTRPFLLKLTPHEIPCFGGFVSPTTVPVRSFDAANWGARYGPPLILIIGRIRTSLKPWGKPSSFSPPPCRIFGYKKKHGEKNTGKKTSCVVSYVSYVSLLVECLQKKHGWHADACLKNQQGPISLQLSLSHAGPAA